jgi:DNA-binding transcriptional MerR regulator
MPNPPDPRSRGATRSIGQVLAVLRPDFPEISISKIRFLESEGLVSPQRAESGYRRYTDADVERLRYVLAVQREHYVPLKVIRDHLAQIDRGMTPPSLGSVRQPEGSEITDAPTATPTPTPPTTKAPVRLSRAELLEASGLTDAALSELERNQIVLPRRGTSSYGRDALTLAVAARRLGEYGLDGRHLRAFKMSADREVGLVEQAIAPHLRRAGGNRDVQLVRAEGAHHQQALVDAVTAQRLGLAGGELPPRGCGRAWCRHGGSPGASRSAWPRSVVERSP